MYSVLGSSFKARRRKTKTDPKRFKETLEKNEIDPRMNWKRCQKATNKWQNRPERVPKGRAPIIQHEGQQIFKQIRIWKMEKGIKRLQMGLLNYLIRAKCQSNHSSFFDIECLFKEMKTRKGHNTAPDGSLELSDQGKMPFRSFRVFLESIFHFQDADRYRV